MRGRNNIICNFCELEPAIQNRDNDMQLPEGHTVV